MTKVRLTFSRSLSFLVVLFSLPFSLLLLFFPLLFCSGKVSLCIQRVAPTPSPIDEIASKYKYTARDFDLSHNHLLYPLRFNFASLPLLSPSFPLLSLLPPPFLTQISNVHFLTGFLQLHTLVLDHNNITSQTTFPHLPSISTLSLRYNAIRTLEPFIVNLAWVCMDGD